MQAIQTANRTTGETSRQWLKRAGSAGIVFFLIKGLAWLVVPFVVARLW